VASGKAGWLVLMAMLLTSGAGGWHMDAFAQEKQGTTRQVKKRVQPEYPELARRMNLTGKVRVEIAVGADGRVISMVPIGGHPVLVKAAEQALQDWRFAPASGASKQVVEIDFTGTQVK